MESESAESSAPASPSAVAAAWESVTAALVSRIPISGRFVSSRRWSPFLRLRPRFTPLSAVVSTGGSLALQVSRGCSVMDQSLSASLELLRSQGLGQLLGIWLLETLQTRLSSSVGPEFWAGLKQPENELEERGRAWVLLTAFRTLLDRLEPFLSGSTPHPKMSFCSGSS